MTEQRNDRKLETLYREAGDVEPDSGLDRIIRARAAEAAGSARSPRRIPWLGGLVTASVAIVAIAVVVQQTPPDGQPPGAFAPEESGGPEAFMAPSKGAQLQQDLSAKASRTAPETREEDVVPPAARGFRAPNSLSEAASELRQRRAAQAEAAPAAPASNQDESAMNRLVVTGARVVVPEPDAFESRDALIERLRQLIDAERIDEARRLLDEPHDLDPELDLPDDIERALREHGSNSPEPDS